MLPRLFGRRNDAGEGVAVQAISPRNLNAARRSSLQQEGQANSSDHHDGDLHEYEWM